MRGFYMVGLRVLIVFLLVFSHLQGLVAQAFWDATAPEVIGVQLNKTEATAGDTVVLTVDAVDPESIISGATVYYQDVDGFSHTYKGTYDVAAQQVQFAIPITAISAPGKWEITKIWFDYEDGTFNTVDQANPLLANGTFEVLASEEVPGSTLPLITNMAVDQDVVNEGETVTLSFRVENAPKEIDRIEVWYDKDGTFYHVAKPAFDSAANLFQVQISTDSLSSGAWSIGHVWVYYKDESFKVIKAADTDLSGGDFVVLESETGSSLPEITSISVDKDVAYDGDTVTVTIHAVDRHHPIKEIDVWYDKNGSLTKTIQTSYDQDAGRVQFQIPIDAFTDIGTWTIRTIRFHYEDVLFKAVGPLDADLSGGSFEVAEMPDEGPDFGGISVSSKIVEAGNVQQIFVEATDDQAVESVTVYYDTPKSASFRSIAFTADGERFVGEMPIDKMTEAGLWTVNWVEIKDSAGKVTQVGRAEADLSSGDFTVLAPVAPISYIVTNNEYWTSKTVWSDVYIAPGATLMIDGNVRIYGNLYVLGKLFSYGGLTVTRGLYASSVSFYNYTYPSSNGEVILNGSNSISSMYVSNRIISNVPFTLYDTPLVSSKGTVQLTGATLPFVTVSINGKNIPLNVDGTFRVKDFYVGTGKTLSVNITDLYGYTYTHSYEVDDIYINDFDKNTEWISGKTQPSSRLLVYSEGNVIGSGHTFADGHFEVYVSNLVENRTVRFEVYNYQNELLAVKEVTVKDTTAPEKPLVHDVTDQALAVTGTAEAGAVITVKANGMVIGSGNADSEGSFSVSIPSRAGGSLVVVYATDLAGNVGDATVVTVKDVTAPVRPVVDKVTDQDSFVSGKTEFEASVTVSVDGVVIGSGMADMDGMFSVSVPVQAVGTELKVTSADMAGNVSEAATVVVVDGIPPAMPVVNEVTDKDESATGQAEPGSTVEVSVNGQVIGSSEVKVDGMFTVVFPAQVAGTPLTFTAVDGAGNISQAAIVVVKDVTPPTAPAVINVTNQDVLVTGTAEVGSLIEVTVNGSVIGFGTAGEDGLFAVEIPVQVAGTELSVTATDQAGHVSEAVSVVVLDVIAPLTPMVNEVTDQATVVSGVTEPGAKVTVSLGWEEIGVLVYQGTADENGQFSIMIPKQQPGFKITVTATDAAGNESAGTSLFVRDVTAPAMPVVDMVTDQDTAVFGQAESGAWIDISVGGSVIGSGPVDQGGYFSLNIPVQAAGTELVVTAADKAGNVSDLTRVVVKDVTAPSHLFVAPVTDQDTTVSGNSEIGAVVVVSVNESVIGSGLADDEGEFLIEIPVQLAGAELVVTATDAAGNVSGGVLVVVKDGHAPDAPVVARDVRDIDDTVTGQAEAWSTVEIRVNGKVIGSTTADSNGTFEVWIPMQAEGTRLEIFSIDAEGNVSEPTFVLVGDGTAPDRAFVNVITDQATTVSGTAEPFATIQVIVNIDEVIAVGEADDYGHFSMMIPVQKAGTQVSVMVTDLAGNVSDATHVVVKDVTAPGKPVVNVFTTNDIIVTGTAEPGSTISFYVKNSNYKIGEGVAGADGKFSFYIPAYPGPGEKFYATATDSSGNTSEETDVIAVAGGWYQVGSTWYFYDHAAAGNKTGWLLEGQTWYYFNAAGEMQTGWKSVAGTWYYFTGSGAMKTGWLLDGGVWYFMKSSGAMATGWVNTGGVWYYFKSSGAMQTGWLLSGGVWYYFKGSGSMQTGWLLSGGKWYYFTSGGAMQTGWVYVSGKWYLFNSSGVMQ
jgi:hypothetical protein